MEDFPQIERFGGFFSILESSLYMILIRVGYEYNNAFQRIDYKFETNHELFFGVKVELH
jgi:hypothetical protein